MAARKVKGTIIDLVIPDDTGRKLQAIGEAGENLEALVAIVEPDPAEFARFIAKSGLANDPTAKDLLQVCEQRARRRPARRGMTKEEFAAKLAGKTRLTKAKATEVINVIFSTDSRKGIIAIELDAGRDFTITGFGTWGTRNRKARMGRNPQTGVRIQIPAKTVPMFRAGKGLKDRVRN